MPSWTHEGLVRLLTERPEILLELLPGLVEKDAKHVHMRPVAADLVSLDPAELRADLVFTVGEPDPELAVIVEVQLGPDPKKRYAWPAYVANLRARLRCRVVLVVLAIDPAVATWSATPFELTENVPFVPLVVGPEAVPRVDDEAAALEAPELAVLSAIAHRGTRGGPRIAHVAMAAAAELAPTIGVRCMLTSSTRRLERRRVGSWRS